MFQIQYLLYQVVVLFTPGPQTMSLSSLGLKESIKKIWFTLKSPTSIPIDSKVTRLRFELTASCRFSYSLTFEVL